MNISGQGNIVYIGDEKMETKEFNDVLCYFPERIKSVLTSVSDVIKSSTYEIRFRLNKPIILFAVNGCNFVKSDSTVSAIDSNKSVTVAKEELQQIVGRICDYSIYSHQNDISQGFVTFSNGHRAGFCGTAIINNGIITTLRDIDSVNIRIARNYEDCADDLLESISKSSEFKGIIVAGAPCTGKTTVLKSFAAKISSSYKYGYMKTVLIDERFEMKGNNGINCDVLCGFPKTEGIIHAMRTLSPEIIICDEVVSMQETDEIIKCCYAGVRFVVSVHSGAIADLLLRPVSEKLVKSGFFDIIVFLDNSDKSGKIRKIIKTEELKREYYCDNCCSF